MRTTQIAILAILAQVSTAAYDLVDDYNPANFFDKFRFFSGSDPSGGYVTYLDKDAAFESQIAQKLDNSIRIGSDFKETAGGSGRKSVRVETIAKYKHGLIVADIKHMPGSVCGVWPAFWTVGDKWPGDGELDIIEGINRQSVNKMALHTTTGCKINKTGDFTGIVETPDCDIRSPTQAPNQGCLFTSQQSNSYGTDFNNKNGGVYAIEWSSSEIAVWFFPRGSVPDDVGSQNPDPKKWNKPTARFSGDCDMDKFVQMQRVIFNTDFCGDWAKALWNSDSVCRAKGPSCEDYVKNNPQDFTEAYWEIYGMKVYKMTESQGASMLNSSTQATPTPLSSAEATGFTTSSSLTESQSGNVEVTGTAEPCQGQNCPNQPTGTISGVYPTKKPCDASKIPPSPTETHSGISPTAGNQLPGGVDNPPGTKIRTTCVTYTSLETVTIVKSLSPSQRSNKANDAIIPIK